MKFTAFSVLVFAILVGLAVSVPKDYCWKHGQGRGAGISGCPSNFDRVNTMCYPQCKQGFTRTGPMCIADCPPDMKDYRATCIKNSFERDVGRPLSCSDKEDKVYDRDVYNYRCFPKCRSGFVAEKSHCKAICPPDYNDDGPYCNRRRDEYVDFKDCRPTYRRLDRYLCIRDEHNIQKATYERGDNNGNGFPLHCADGEEVVDGLCYNKLKPGYFLEGSVVKQRCPPDWRDVKTGCLKPSYSTPSSTSQKAQCSANEDLENGLCYAKCPNGLSGSGSMCWNHQCPSGWFGCGTVCTPNEATCNSRNLEIPTLTTKYLATIVGMLHSTEELTKAASNSKKAAAYSKTSADYASKIKNYAAIIKKAKEGKGEAVTEAAATQMAYDTVGFFMLDASSSTEDLALTAATNNDPKGFIAAGEVFSAKVCNLA